MQDIKIGTSIEGGTFGGIINVNGTHKGVIWAPKSEGQIKSILLPSRHKAAGAFSPFDCEANTKALVEAGSPAAVKVVEMNINGYQDWLIPSRDVLELGYRHFKRTTEENYCRWRDGENNNSVPPGWIYTEEFPAMTELEAFRKDGDEAFDPYWYWSSTVLPNEISAFFQDFINGLQSSSGLSAECRVRAVRLIQL